MKGKNLANPLVSEAANSILFATKRSDVCIFISYTKEDREEVIELGNYILNTGFDIYLDVYDLDLQQAVENEDPIAITQSIERGLSFCTNVICVVSEETVNSWWVPYEIGFGKRAEKPLATLILKDTVTIPSYLEITQLLKGTRTLNEYLIEVSKKSKILLESTSAFIDMNQCDALDHPLDNVLEWDN